MAFNAHSDPSEAHPGAGFSMDRAQATMRRMLEEQSAATERLVQALHSREREHRRLKQSVKHILGQEPIPVELPHILATSEEEYQQLQAALAEKNRELAQKEQEIAGVRKLERTLQEKELLIQNLRRLLQTKEEALTDVLAAMDQQEQEVREIQNTLQTKERELARRNELLGRQAQVVRLLQKEGGLLEARVRQVEEQREELERNTGRLEAEYRAARETLERKGQDVRLLREEIAALVEGTGPVAGVDAQPQLEGEMAAVLEQVRKLKRELEDSRQAASDLKRLGKVLLKKDKQLKELRAEVETRLSEEEQAQDQLKLDTKTSREQLERLQREHQELVDQLAQQAGQEGKLLADQLRSAQQENAELRRRLSEMAVEAEEKLRARVAPPPSPPPSPPLPPPPAETFNWRELVGSEVEIDLLVTRFQRGEIELPRWDPVLLERADILAPVEEEMPALEEGEGEAMPPPPPLLEEARRREVAAIEPLIDLPTPVGEAAKRRRISVSKGKASIRPAVPAAGRAGGPAPPQPVVPPRLVPQLQEPKVEEPVEPLPEIPLEEYLPREPGLVARLRGLFRRGKPTTEEGPPPEEMIPSAAAAPPAAPAALPFDQEELWAAPEIGEGVAEEEEEREEERWDVTAISRKWRAFRPISVSEQAPPAGENLLEAWRRLTRPASAGGARPEGAGEVPRERDWRTVLRRFRPKRMMGKSLPFTGPVPSETAELQSVQAEGAGIPDQDVDLQQLRQRVDTLEQTLRQRKAVPAPAPREEAAAGLLEEQVVAAPEAITGISPGEVGMEIRELLEKQAWETEALQKRLEDEERAREAEVQHLRDKLARTEDVEEHQHLESLLWEKEQEKETEVQRLRQAMQQLFSQHFEQVRLLREDLQRKAGELEKATQALQDIQIDVQAVEEHLHQATASTELRQALRAREEQIEEDLQRIFQRLQKPSEMLPEVVQPAEAEEVLGPASRLAEEEPFTPVEELPMAPEEVAAEEEAIPPEEIPPPPAAEVIPPELELPGALETMLSQQTQQVHELREDLQRKAADLGRALQGIQAEVRAMEEYPQPTVDTAELRQAIHAREERIREDIQELLEELQKPADLPPKAVSPVGEVKEVPAPVGEASLWGRLVASLGRAELPAVPPTAAEVLPPVKTIYIVADKTVARAWQVPVAEFLACFRIEARWRSVRKGVTSAEMSEAGAVIFLYPWTGWEPQVALEERAAGQGIVFHQWPLRTLARLQIDLLDHVIGYADS